MFAVGMRVRLRGDTLGGINSMYRVVTRFMRDIGRIDLIDRSYSPSILIQFKEKESNTIRSYWAYDNEIELIRENTKGW